jgi:hypothetical protein
MYSSALLVLLIRSPFSNRVSRNNFTAGLAEMAFTKADFDFITWSC